MRILVITLLFFIHIPAYSQEMKEIFGQKELDLPASFTDSVRRWKPKITISTPARVAFGPFSIYEIDKSKPKKLGRKKEKDGWFWNTITTEKNRAASMTMNYNKDTIAVNMLFTTIEEWQEKSFAGLLLSRSDISDPSKTTNVFNEIMISVPADSSDWRFMPAGSLRDDPDMRNSHYFGKLVSPVDTITIFYTTGFKGHTRTWVGHRTGMVFKKEKSILGAVQFYNKKYVWMKENISPIEEQVTGAFIATLLSIEHK